jgi:hypothetical protein
MSRLGGVYVVTLMRILRDDYMVSLMRKRNVFMVTFEEAGRRPYGHSIMEAAKGL